MVLRILAVSLLLFGILVIGVANEGKEAAQGNEVRVGVAYSNGTFVETNRGVIGANPEKEEEMDTANVAGIIMVISGVTMFIVSCMIKKE